MLVRLAALLVTFAVLALLKSAGAAGFTEQEDPALYQGNNCVQCHSRISSQSKLTSRYLEWHLSVHKEKGVGCEKCHGGDPGISDPKKAHLNMAPPREAASPLNPQNLPDTCSKCHSQITSSFVESRHYQKLKSAGIGPSCSTCHAHMASQVVNVPEETTALCTQCHNPGNKLITVSLEIPKHAAEVIEALQRANSMVVWADRLLEAGEAKKINLADEEREMKIVRAILSEAKTSWHAFNLDVVKRKADDAFEQATKLKDVLRNKIYPQ